MKKSIILTILVCSSVCLTDFFCHEQEPVVKTAIGQILVGKTDSFSLACRNLQAAVESRSPSLPQLQNLYLQSRIAYKKMEWAAEYFVLGAARLLNGPPVQEVEMAEEENDGPGLKQAVLKPAGLQVIETFLFPSFDTVRKNELLHQLSLLQPVCRKYRAYFSNNKIPDWQVFDAVKLEVFRIISLGITGFDNPLTLKSMEESAAALESLKEVLAFYPGKENKGILTHRMDNAIQYLHRNTDFNSFNRMEFITKHANPITGDITDLEEELPIRPYKNNRLLNQEAKTLFDTNAFNVNAYAPNRSSFISKEKIDLGKLLFSDPLLSGNGKRSCISCHQPSMAFTDGMVKNTVIGRQESLDRNTPTLINAAVQPSLFYDMRVKTLEDQSHSVVQSTREMHGSMELSGEKLWLDKKYRQMFFIAFPYEDKNRVDTFEIMNALASYIRSLTLLNSRFDEYMRGDNKAMNPEEINGFNLFMGKAKCATCHYMPLFNGTFPPQFKKMESEVIGVPGTEKKSEIDPDLGRYNIIQTASFKHAFKITTVRNAGRTAPYMHNGVFSKLEQVIEFYNKGGGTGLGFKVDNQTLPPEKLNLTEKETKEMVAFIRALDSRY